MFFLNHPLILSGRLRDTEGTKDPKCETGFDFTFKFSLPDGRGVNVPDTSISFRYKTGQTPVQSQSVKTRRTSLFRHCAFKYIFNTFSQLIMDKILSISKCELTLMVFALPLSSWSSPSPPPSPLRIWISVSPPGFSPLRLRTSSD